MKRSFKLTALLLALLMLITTFVSVALAEGEETDPVTEETSTEGESSLEGGESSDAESGTESGGDTESSEEPTVDPNAFFVDIVVEGVSAEAVKVTLNGEAASGKYTGTVSPLMITVEANAGYKVLSATFEYGYANGPLVELEGKFSGTTLNLAAGATFTLRIVAELVPVPAALSVETMGITGYTLYVNGEAKELSAAQLMTGDEIKLDFAVEGEFVAADATLTVNGEAKTVEGLSYSFKLTGDTKVVFTYKVVPVTVTLEGPGKFEFQLTNDSSYVADVVNNAVGTVTKTIFLIKDVSYKVITTPALGYELSGGVEISEPRRDVLNGVYYFIPSGATTVKATMKASGGSLPSTNCTVQINVGMGGNVVAGNQTVLGGMGTNIVLSSGESLTFTITPDEGYILDVFRVGGVAIALEGNTYTLSNIVASSTNVSVVFKSDKISENPDDVIGVEDIDWNAAQITVDISGGKFVDRAVLDKIGTLSGSGKYVEFKSESGTVYFPYGGKSEGSASSVNLSVNPLVSGALYDIINGAINSASGGTASYKAYSFNFGITAPEGTLVSFKLGNEYVGSSAVMLLYNSATSSFFTKDNASEPLATLSDGTSGKYAYDNEGIVVISKETIGGITIEATVSTEGGAINPAGVATVYKGGYKTYYITAQEGYVIKSVRVDGNEISDAIGQKIYSYTFEDIRENHTINVEFEADATVGGEDQSSGGLTTVIVILIIVLVAIAGAAALFIVKWRQEKF
ncbi:MAG: hypothetical protein J6Q72_03545 [Clostridia bacterium]|nr:hypothetical protein [Clostridia bacterium]